MEGKEYYEDDDEKRNSDSSENNDNDSDDFGLPDLENADEAYSDKDEDSFEDSYGDESSESEYSYSSESDEDEYSDPSSEYSYYDDENAGHEDEEVENQHYVHGLDDDEPSGPSAGVIILIIVLVLAIAGAAFWFFYWKDRNEPVATPKPEPKQETVVEDTTTKEPVEEEPIIKDTPDQSTTTPGQVNVLENRTGRYYVVIASFIDDDLARDYADKLAKEGVGSTILSPNREPGFYRLAVADFASLNDAAVKSEQLKSEYGSDVWVLKY